MLITRPSSSMLLAVVREELSATVAPAVAGDTQATQCMSMVDEILRIVANRCAHEIEWMLGEIADIVKMAEDFIDAGHDRDGTLAEGLQRLRSQPDVYGADELSDRYSQASELLSLCLESAMSTGGEAREAAETLLARRSEHEVALRGADQALVGRG